MADYGRDMLPALLAYADRKTAAWESAP